MSIRADPKDKGSPLELSIKHLAWAVIEAMQDSLVVTNPAGNIIYLNHAAEKLMDVTFTRVFGKRIDHVLSLLPVVQAELPTAIKGSPSQAGFDAGSMQGYWLLRLGNSLPLINISVSSLPPGSRGGNDLLFTMRRIREEVADLEPAMPVSRGRAPVTRDEFHARIRNALQVSQRWNLEHSLICIEFDMARPGAREYEDIVSMLLRSVRRTDVSCQLGAQRYAVLLESYSLAQAIRRSFGLIRALSSNLPEERARQRDLNIWIGVAPLDRFGPDNAARLIDMAMQACSDARKSGRGSGVRVYHRGQESIVNG